MAALAHQPSLQEADPELQKLIDEEQQRQFSCLELIASENFTSLAVIQCLGSCLTNKYSEGLPGKRYYGGNEFIDQIENLAIKRSLEAFHLDPKVWGANVQPYSGSTANFAVYTALLQPHDRIMGLDLPSGGHLTHGYYTAKKKVSATSIYFESLPYRVDPQSGYIDYDKLEESAKSFRPKMLICGASAYPREWDYKRLRAIADSVGALLFCDMAHYAGLVAGEVLKSPFEYCDVVSTTTHKSLRGPRAGLIFFKREFEEKINFSVFPSIQGGPHNHQIAAIATQMKEVCAPQWKDYALQIQKNCRALAAKLISNGHKLATDGTDNHLILWDLRPEGITGSKFESFCDVVHITLNKNAINGDSSALVPGGVRIGTPALTSRGFKEADFEQVADFLHRGLVIAKGIVKKNEEEGKTSLVDFKKALVGNAEVEALAKEVTTFAQTFYLPGYTPPSSQ